MWLASVEDHSAQLARQGTDAFLASDNAFDGAEAALRIVPELPEVGAAILRIIKPQLSPRSDSEYRTTEEVLRCYSTIGADAAPPIFTSEPTALQNNGTLINFITVSIIIICTLIHVNPIATKSGS